MTNPADAFLEFDIQLQLGDFSLDLSARFSNGITAVFGPSGAGKSTLLSCLAGGLKPDRGRIILDGECLYSSTDRVRRSEHNFRAAMVFQDGALFPHMTVRRNIQYGYRLTKDSDRVIHPGPLIDFLRLRHLLDRFPSTLSGGERQRVALARALAMSPRLLLLDEPVASLDMALRNEVVGHLKRVHQHYQMPMIYVSHALSDVMFLASDALAIEHGRAKSFGPARDLALGFASSTESAIDNLLLGAVTAKDTIQVDNASLSVPLKGFSNGDQVTVSIEASDIILASEIPEAISARNILPGKVASIQRGPAAAFVTVHAGAELIAELTHESIDEMNLTPGTPIYAIFKSSSILVTAA